MYFYQLLAHTRPYKCLLDEEPSGASHMAGLNSHQETPLSFPSPEASCSLSRECQEGSQGYRAHTFARVQQKLPLSHPRLGPAPTTLALRMPAMPRAC